MILYGGMSITARVQKLLPYLSENRGPDTHSEIKLTTIWSTAFLKNGEFELFPIRYNLQSIPV